MNEIWKSIAGYENLYEISNMGNIWSIYTKKLLQTYPNEEGYLRLKLFKNKKKKWHRVHRLVLQAFYPDFDEKLDTNHEDFNKANNYITNLTPMTHEENNNHYLTSEKYKTHLKLISTTNYTGVQRKGSKNKTLRARITKGNKKYSLGYFFDTEEARIKAAECYDIASILLNEEHAVLNFESSRELMKNQELVYPIICKLFHDDNR
jgi:hypothetical protein